MYTVELKTNNQAHCKQLKDLKQLSTAHGVDFFYRVEEDENDKYSDKYYYYFYTVNGMPNYVRQININMFADVESVFKTLTVLSTDETRFLKTFPDKQGLLTDIKNAVTAKQWTSNADALFCELAGDFELAERVRKNRAEYIERQEAEEAQKRAEEKARDEEEAKAKAQKQKETEEKAISDFANNKKIDADMFLTLCKRYNITVPIKTIGYINDNVGYVVVRMQNGVEDYVYGVKNTKRKSKSAFLYIEKLYNIIKA